ncbi:ferredoxin [Glutamicibacter halophytocola]|uniref:ferredoxin n=1 Tax=Glutamicibacter halophytocola TaxID=1933880 RepID=UPI0015592DA8|nr:ferredoxin [Glutamicibacter halophytocola]NQD40004.1 ferredoxin [Glutamicibacter halophytocola]
MKIRVHGAMCIASGNCGLTAPRSFQNRAENGGFAELLQEEPAPGDEQAALEAEYLCPSGAIQIDKHRIPAPGTGSDQHGEQPGS